VEMADGEGVAAAVVVLLDEERLAGRGSFAEERENPDRFV